MANHFYYIPTPGHMLQFYQSHINQWHHYLGHPNSKVLKNIVFSNFLSISTMSNLDVYNSCLCNKSHCFSFGISTLINTRPLEIIFTNVWGPFLITPVNNYQYYVFFIDYFFKNTLGFIPWNINWKSLVFLKNKRQLWKNISSTHIHNVFWYKKRILRFKSHIFQTWHPTSHFSTLHSTNCGYNQAMTSPCCWDRTNTIASLFLTL